MERGDGGKGLEVGYRGRDGVVLASQSLGSAQAHCRGAIQGRAKPSAWGTESQQARVNLIFTTLFHHDL